VKHPQHWSRTDLHLHLQHAIDLEFWTIPLYLTALYSIKGLKHAKSADFPEAAKLIESVVFQEMLHLEIACNLGNALGLRPQFNTPAYDPTKKIPFIFPKKEDLPEVLRDFQVRLGPLDKEHLKLFCAIEIPSHRRTFHWQDESHYRSIGELYEALRQGVEHLWDEGYVGDANNVRQKDNFREYHNKNGKSHGFSQPVRSAEDARKALLAIIDQGEGADAASVPPEYQPASTPKGKEFDAVSYDGHLSHYQKFRVLLHHSEKLPETYPVRTGASSQAAQQALDEHYRKFLAELQSSFHSVGPDMTDAFWGLMSKLGSAIIEVWESGSCPVFPIHQTETRMHP